MKVLLVLAAVTILIVGSYVLLYRNDGVWELRVQRNGKTAYFRGFQSEEDCYAFYEANRRNRENLVHGCYPVR